MTKRNPTNAKFHDVLEAAARLQQILPDAVLVGGTAAAHHAGHRISFDDDHVLTDLQHRFDAVLRALEETTGWVTSRVRPQVLILGSLNGIETGIRQLIRRRPLETEVVLFGGRSLQVPTIAEIFRIKGWLVLRRNAVRDYLDVVALADRLGARRSAELVLSLDEYYEDQIGADGLRISTQLIKQLAEPAPYDLSAVELANYRELDQRWRDWPTVVTAARALASDTLDLISERA